MDVTLAGGVTLVTGGGSGIGEAACYALADAGAAVAVVDVRAESARLVADRIAANGGRALALGADVGDEEAVSAAITRAAAELGGLHVVFANAGINGMQTPIDEMTLDEWNATLTPNLTGTFLTVKHSIPHLRAAGGGSIVVTASVNGNTLFSQPGYAAYSTSKAGAVAFTKMAALELARWSIRVNAILPGAIETAALGRYLATRDPSIRETMHARTAMRRNGRPDDISPAAVYLASPAACWVTGKLIEIDGGAADDVIPKTIPDL
jgi:NAD(P)-dependent dehydrogenase (short-subunit alcohol dehydrogenase family)